MQFKEWQNPPPIYYVQNVSQVKVKVTVQGLFTKYADSVLLVDNNTSEIATPYLKCLKCYCDLSSGEST